jgi:hypothetical protein
MSVYLKEVGWEGVDRVCLSKHREEWLAVLYVVMSSSLPYKLCNYLAS